jgi:hypothetical protein
MFNPGMEKPDFLAHSARESFMAKCHAIYDGFALEEVKYVLTPAQFAALDLVFYKNLSQNAAAKQLNLSQHGVIVRLQGAARRMEKWKKWKAEKTA